MRTHSLPLRISSFGVAKAGNTDAEWEDAAAHSEGRGRFAVADGATAAYGAGLWSHLLARGFITDPFGLDDDDAFRIWVDRRADEWTQRTRIDGEVPYYIRHAQDRGSHSTFLGVEVDSGIFAAIAVGDTCLFHVRGDSLQMSFPLSDPEAFGFQPDLVATSPGSAPRCQRCRGAVEDGDVLFGVTDAVAECLLRALAAGDASGIVALCQADTGIDEFVHAARSAGTLRNDDVAVVRCVIGEVSMS